MIIANVTASASTQMVYFGESWVEAFKINLQGVVVECDLTQVYSIPFSVLALYNTGFGGYTIQGYSIDFAIVRNVSLSNAGVGKYTFNVEVDGYTWNQLGTKGVLDPVNEWNIVEQEDGSSRLSHRISARGMSGQASIGIASIFVSGLAGLGGFNSGISNLGLNLPCIISSGFSQNTINGVASISENYILDPSVASGVNGIIRYTATIQDSTEDVAVATINGEIFGCDSGSAASLYNLFDYQAALSQISDAGIENTGNLQGTNFVNLLNKNSSTDTLGKKITFSATFNTDITGVYLDYSVVTSSESFTTVSIRGSLKGRGDLKPRWLAVSGAYGGISEVYSLIPTGTSLFPFNTNPVNYSETLNAFLGEIEFSATFTDKIIPPSGFAKLNYSLSVQPCLQKYTAEPLLNQNGIYYITDLGFHRRGNLSIRGEGITITGILPSNKENFLRNFLQNVAFSNAQSGANGFIVEEDEIVINDSGRSIAFNFGWSYESNAFNI